MKGGCASETERGPFGGTAAFFDEGYLVKSWGQSLPGPLSLSPGFGKELSPSKMSVWILGAFCGAMLANFSHSAEHRVKGRDFFFLSFCYPHF